jgi:predicted sulfurtransferase
MAVNKNSVVNIAGYKFEPLDDAIDLIPIYQEKCDELLLKGTMLISKNGINFSIAGTQEATDSFINFIEEDNRFLDIPLKVTYSETQPFRRMKVRLKKEIISLGRKDINPREMTGERISPEVLKNLLDKKEEVLVLDTRNEYETRVGKFENAIDLNLDTFRDFPKAVESLPEEYKDKQIVMYCTGGIRCEKASAVMMKAGFADVKQLDGGVLEYFKETGGAYWEGDCFVFDERVALDKELNETEYIYCYICREPLSAEEKASPDFKINEHCPYCISSNS